MLKPKAKIEYRDGSYTVDVTWPDAGVDRPCTGGWSTGKNLALAKRLILAIDNGAACPNPKIVKDYAGKTYVSYDHVVMGRYMNADLKKLGF